MISSSSSITYSSSSISSINSSISSSSSSNSSGSRSGRSSSRSISRSSSRDGNHSIRIRSNSSNSISSSSSSGSSSRSRSSNLVKVGVIFRAYFLPNPLQIQAMGLFFILIFYFVKTLTNDRFFRIRSKFFFFNFFF